MVSGVQCSAILLVANDDDKYSSYYQSAYVTRIAYAKWSLEAPSGLVGFRLVG